MKPHMAYINNTLIKKQLAKNAKDPKTAYVKYRAKADKALKAGFPLFSVIQELEREIETIMSDQRESNDPLFMEGVHNAKVSCISSIRTIIAELKGEN